MYAALDGLGGEGNALYLVLSVVFLKNFRCHMEHPSSLADCQPLHSYECSTTQFYRALNSSLGEGAGAPLPFAT